MAIKGRRAFLFTAIALVVIAAIIIFTTISSTDFETTRAEARRVHLVDRYLTNLEDDLPRAVYIASFRSLIGLEEYISSTGTYVNNFDTYFTSLFQNGTINGTAYTIMENSTFDDFSARFAQLSLTHGITANLSLIGIQAYQTDPWYVQLNVSVRVQLTDQAGVVHFDSVVPVRASVPIEDIKDPLYSVGTQGKAPNTVQQSNISQPYITASNDTTNLQQLLNESSYIASTKAPSFLSRFEGNLSASPNGIQSLVGIDELRAQSLPIDTCKAIIDYVYFGSANGGPDYYIINMDPTEFWIDDPNLATYNALGKIVGVAPCP